MNMDKATRLVRRSSIRLKSLSGGHSDLLMIVSQLQEVKTTFKAFVKAQAVLADDLLKWSSSGLEANAVHKTFVHYSELSQLWTDVQKEFSDSIKSFKSEFEQILQGEQHVDIAREDLRSRQEALEKCEKDISKNKDSAAKTHVLQTRLKRCEKASILARNELSEKIHENEAIKLIRLKKGLKKFGAAYIDMAIKCNSIYKAHGMITQELPDVEGKNIQDLMYRETSCEGYVRDARNQVCLYNCHASSAISPPYSPTDNMNNLSIDVSNTSINDDHSRNNIDGESPRRTFPRPSAPPRSLSSSMGSISPASPVEPIYPPLPIDKDFSRQQGSGDIPGGEGAVFRVNTRVSSSPPSSVFFKRINSSNQRNGAPTLEDIPMPYSRSRAKQVGRHLKWSSNRLSSEPKSLFDFRRNAHTGEDPDPPAKPLKPPFKQHSNNPPPYNPFDYANISGC